MKDQYFANVNDYRNFGLLRAILAGTAVRLGVCWMLTTPDGKRSAALMPVETPEVQPVRKHIIFLENFFDELRRKVPTGKYYACA